MATKKKMLMSSAGAGGAGGAGLDITDVFSTYLYDGTGAAQTITNGIDLDGEGGLVITKRRDSSTGNGPYWNDTERGISSYVRSDSDGGDGAQNTSTGSISSVTSSGYVLGTFNGWNNSSGEYASWTWRKAPKFFDCVTWSGDGTDARQISHSLANAPGCIIVKNTSSSSTDWMVYHRSLSDDLPNHSLSLVLNQTYQQMSWKAFGEHSTQTSSVFTLGTSSPNEFFVNQSGQTYVAYLFAHNDGDGGFGPDGSDIIKCGSYTGNGLADGPEINLGWEPQWVMIKGASQSSNWAMLDTMRGFSASTDQSLFANLSNPEGPDEYAEPTATGFKLKQATYFPNSSGETYIYMAIRRGPLAQPESGTEVFAPVAYTGTGSARTTATGFVTDLSIIKSRATYSPSFEDRLRGANKVLESSSSGAEVSTSQYITGFDLNNGVELGTDAGVNQSGTGFINWSWKRAPGFCDVQAFTLGSSANREVKHNLQAIPEMIWWKERSDTSYWMFWHKDFTSSQYMSLHLSDAIATSTNIWGTSAPTSTGWYMKETAFGGSGNTCISYTFATVAGVSKVGSVSHTSGSATNVDCGFTSGARFILLKVTDSSGSWFVYDTARGIVAGNDARLKLDSTAAENTGNDDIDPLSSGFTITSTVSTGSYIFYAIA